MRSIGRNLCPILFKFGKNIPFCRSLNNFANQNNLTVFNPHFSPQQLWFVGPKRKLLGKSSLLPFYYGRTRFDENVKPVCNFELIIGHNLPYEDFILSLLNIHIVPNQLKFGYFINLQDGNQLCPRVNSACTLVFIKKINQKYVLSHTKYLGSNSFYLELSDSKNRLPSWG